MGEHFLGLAAEQYADDAAAAVRGHDNEVAAPVRCRPDDRLPGAGVLDLIGRDGHAGLLRGTLHEIEDSRGWIERTYRTSLKRWELKYKDTSVSRYDTEAEIRKRLDEIEVELKNIEEMHALGYLSGEELQEQKEKLELEARELRLKLEALREKERSGANAAPASAPAKPADDEGEK